MIPSREILGRWQPACTEPSDPNRSKQQIPGNGDRCVAYLMSLYSKYASAASLWEFLSSLCTSLIYLAISKFNFIFV